MTNHDVSIGELAEQNPWWKTEQFPSDDPEKEKYEKSSFKWKPRLLKILENEDVIYTLRGPRRVGKTTSLKIIIERYLSEGVTPRNIFYFSCARLYNLPFRGKDDLASVITEYLSFRKTEERAFIFIDEVTQVQDWQLRMQPLLREGMFKNCTAVFTGNHCIDVRKRPNSLAGLRGEDNLRKHPNLNLVLLQPKFSEYVETQDETIGEQIEKLNLRAHEKRKELFLSLASNIVPNEIDELALYTPKLNSLLSQYLITGGSCQATHECISTGTIRQNTYETFINLIRKDILDWGYNEYHAKQLLGNIIETIAKPVTWDGLKENTAIRDHKTSNSYAEMLIDTFVVNCHYKLKLGKSHSRPYYTSPHKKIYIRDPFIFHACHGWVRGREPFALSLEFLREQRSRLLESVFSDHLTRLAFKLHRDAPGFKPSDYIFFWRAKDDREVDFLVRMDNKFLAVEVKDTNNIKTTRGIKEFIEDAPDAFRCGIITSETNLAIKDKYVVVPASILLLLI